MTEEPCFPEISLPCLRGQVEDWIYYVTLMTYGEVSLRFKPAEEIHKHATLNELIQRALTKRADEISDYIIRQKQHFFNAIIAGVYEGEPNWIEVEFPDRAQSSNRVATGQIQGAIGVLELSGAERIFAIDGQHRVEGIKLATATKGRHASEEAVVVFVAHNNNRSGLQRTRRLFSTLNRYAKPVTLGEIIALDEDDGIAITTRQLLYHHPVLKQEGVIAPSKTKSIPVSNKEALTSIQSLYELLEWLLLRSAGTTPKKIREYKQLRRPSAELERLFEESFALIDEAFSVFDELRHYAGRAAGPSRAEPFRNRGGGSLLFRPVGLSILGASLATAIQSGHEIRDILIALAGVNRDLADKPWRGLLYDPANQRMRPRISKSDIAVAAKLWLGLAGLLTDASELRGLVGEYAGAMGVETSSARRALHALGLL